MNESPEVRGTAVVRNGDDPQNWYYFMLREVHGGTPGVYYLGRCYTSHKPRPHAFDDPRHFRVRSYDPDASAFDRMMARVNTELPA